VNRSILAFALSLVVLVLASSAAAQNKAVETQARALQKKAMQEDYLATEFAKAEEKLNQAVAKCGGDKCSAPLRAELKRDLGVVQIGGQIDKEKGMAQWVEALKLDPTLQLDPDVKTKEFEKLFEEAKRQAAGAPPSGGAKEPTTGDFTHTPIPEQTVRTPLPIYAEYGGSEQVVRVVAKYKGFGMPDWKTFELKKLGNGYGGQLPCADVQLGEVLYYLQGFNAQSDPVATSGDRNNPFRVAAKQKIDGEPPHLPNQPAPKQCAEASTDCPPDFPRCKKAVVAPIPEMTEEDASKKDEGDECEESSECKSSTCKAGKCAAPEKKFRRIWVGISGSFDNVFLGSASEVCRLGADGLPFGQSGYYCTRDRGGSTADFPLRPDVDRAGEENQRIVPGQLNTISGGVVPFANTRILLTFDYALNTNVLLGGRLGYTFGTYSGSTPAGVAGKNEGKAFMSLHLEARGTYLIGKDALLKPFAMYVVFGAGITEMAAKIDVNVVVTGETPPKQTVQAWTLSSPVFVSPGVGFRMGIGDRAAIMIAPVKATFAIGGNGLLAAWSPEIGAQLGF